MNGARSGVRERGALVRNCGQSARSPPSSNCAFDPANRQTQSRLLEQMRLERSRDKAFADTGSPVKSHAFPVGIDFLAATKPPPDLPFAPDQRACDGRVQAAFTTFSSCPTLRAVVSDQK
jgi:hypothetical protein